MYNRSLTQSIILFVPVILVGLGIMMIYSASSIIAAERYHDGMYFLKKQALFGLCGIGCMLIMMRVPYSFLKRCAYPLWLFSLVLLALVLIPGIGVRAGGSVRWLSLGFFSFQPAELAPGTVLLVINQNIIGVRLGRPGQDPFLAVRIDNDLADVDPRRA